MTHIAIIEDNAQNARMVAKLLTKAGHTVDVYETGEDGLTGIFDSPPDLVLIHLGLPDIDGQTVIGIIRQQPELVTARVLAFTAWPEDQAIHMAQAYGFDGVIIKPINTRTFVSRVESYLKKPAQTTEKTPSAE
jgi:DNA-binding response OmpR family regulator